MKSQSKSYNQLISELQDNFLFQLSLGSKELFHSNLLAWLLEQENEKGEHEAFKQFVLEFAKIELSDMQIEYVRIRREWKNLDLTLEWGAEENINFIFLENKLKSLPKGWQLKEYNQKIQEIMRGKRGDKLDKIAHTKLLLTPLSLEKEEQNDFDNLGWTNITYTNEIINFLGGIRSIHFKNKDVPLLIDKYISFLECLTGLLHKFNLGKGNLIKFKKRAFDFYSYEPIEEKSFPDEKVTSIKLMSRIRELRIHDLILKLAHQNLGQVIREKIKSKSAEMVPTYRDLNSPGNVHISTNFTRSTGITDIKFNIKGQLHVGLQLQGNSLKYLVEVYNKELEEKNVQFAFNLLNNKLWFHHVLSDEMVMLSGKGRKHKEKLKIDSSTTFNSYGLNFIYLKKDVSEYANRSIEHLAEFMASEVDRVLDNIKEFQKHVP